MTINAWITYIVGGAFLLLLAALAVVLVINADQRATLAANDAARAMLVQQNKEWAQKTARTNAAFARIKAAEAANARAIVAAEQAASDSEKNLTGDADALAALRFGGDDCAQVSALRTYYLEKFR